MYFVGLDVHKKTISYCTKDASGRVHQGGKIGATRRELDCWMKTLPQPWIVAMEPTIFTGWIYDHLLPHAAQVKVAHPLMLRAMPRRRRKMTGLMPARSPIASAATFFRNATWPQRRFGIGAECYATDTCWCAR
jgi:hypothetical protein